MSFSSNVAEVFATYEDYLDANLNEDDIYFTQVSNMLVWTQLLPIVIGNICRILKQPD